MGRESRASGHCGGLWSMFNQLRELQTQKLPEIGGNGTDSNYNYINPVQPVHAFDMRLEKYVQSSMNRDSILQRRDLLISGKPAVTMSLMHGGGASLYD